MGKLTNSAMKKRQVTFSKHYFMVQPRKYFDDDRRVDRATQRSIFNAHGNLLNRQYQTHDEASVSISDYPESIQHLIEVCECLDARF